MRAGLKLSTLLLLATCAPAPARPVRVVLITLDTLRYDAFAGTAESPSAMPHLAARAAGGASFARFYAVTSMTQPSHATMLTGLSPWEHGVTSNGSELAADFTTVAEILHEAGFETRAVVASLPLAHRFGFAQGFDAFDDRLTTPLPRARDAEAITPERRFFARGDTVTARALEALDAARAPRQLFWFHYFDAHEPYGDSEGSRLVRDEVLARIAGGEPVAHLLDEVRAGYLADARSLDAQLEVLLARLDADRARFDTHVLLVADHGESLGEDGALGHGDRVSDEQIHVPAVLLSPRVTPGVRSQVTGTIDVAPTLLALAGVAAPALAGRDLSAPELPEASVAGMRPTFRGRAREKLLDGHEHPLPEHCFYEVAPDGTIHRGSARQLEAGTPEATAARFRALEETLEQRAAERPLDPAVEEALRALGYVR
jgi:arylsulfatase A-like enzyme